MSARRGDAGGGPQEAALSVSRLVDRGPDRRRSRPPVDTGATPPGWPPQVLPPGVCGWQASAGLWLIDQCPADYRAYAVWRRHPVALAWVASLHVAAQLEAMRQAFRTVRVELADDVDPETVTAARHAIEAEGLRLRATQRGIGLVLEAMRGEVYVPKL